MRIEAGRVSHDSASGCVTWTVEDFFSHPQNKDDYRINSPAFSALGSDWWLNIKPYFRFGGSSRTRVNLVKGRDHPPVACCFEFGIRGRSGAEVIAYRGEAEIEESFFFQEHILLPARWRQYREKFAPGGVLSVFCRIRERRPPSATPVSDTSTRTEDFGQVSQDCVDGPSKSCNSRGAHKVVENLKKLLLSEENCDVTLKVQNQEFRAHKAILGARSSVFGAMFRHEMSEKLSNEVLITDCDPDAFRIFLKHAYTGEAEGISSSNAFNVFSVANKYDAPELKVQCKDCIASNITVGNVCDVVAFSLLHSDTVLLEGASQFFTKHLSRILLTNEWQCFFREHATAANELLVRASKFHIPPE